MAASKNHGQLVTHAHILLLGFVVSFIYALCHKLWLHNGTSTLALIQFYLHQIGILLLTAGLFLLYGQLINPETIDPLLALASISVFISLILMLLLFIKQSVRT
ncbi:TonB-dependent receptor [Dasania marina]|uniref:TonB-dependent receptor n=1 Tax=Dasania marina TaxID=471499 RepID=UPI001F0ADCC0|nr:TonB-dependent receptor [Dasania marina]